MRSVCKSQKKPPRRCAPPLRGGELVYLGAANKVKAAVVFIPLYGGVPDGRGGLFLTF